MSVVNLLTAIGLSVGQSPEFIRLLRIFAHEADHASGGHSDSVVVNLEHAISVAVALGYTL